MNIKTRFDIGQDVIAECAYEDYDYIVDTENNIIFDDENYFKLVDILNQQDKENQQLKKQLEQDKISFAIEQLEKVKEKLLEEWQSTEENYEKACDLCLKLFKGEKV